MPPHPNRLGRTDTLNASSARSAENAWITSVVLGEAHLRRILRAYANYYNRVRTHLALEKDTPSVAPRRRLDQSWLSLSSAGFITNTPGWLNW